MSTPEPAEFSAPDATAIAVQNDAFRRLACLGLAPDQPIQGRIHVTRSLMEADSDFRYGAENPDNPETTVRVLTIMMAHDW